MRLLLDLLTGIDHKTRLAHRTGCRHGDEQRLVVINRQIRFPLGIRERRVRRVQNLAQGRPAVRQIGITPAQVRHRRIFRQSAGRIAQQMNHRIAVLNVIVQLEQRRAAAGDEIFLHRHADIGASQLLPEFVAVVLELLGDGGQENLLDVDHASQLQVDKCGVG